jgi:23S rRNA pseudouridine2605 synthase
MSERLQVYLARHGVASRRAAERMIAAGRVRVNGRTVTAMGTSVDGTADRIEVDRKLIGALPVPLYFIVNKPVGVVSTVSDPAGRPKVTDLVDVPDRLYPVGRLDADSEGLILLTNDGDLALRLMHPRFEVEKEYHALIDKDLDQEAVRKLEQGIDLGDGVSAPARVRALGHQGGRVWVSIVLREGRRRQVRRMLAKVGHQVRRLVRVRIGSVSLGALQPGESRPLAAAELAAFRSGIP